MNTWYLHKPEESVTSQGRVYKMEWPSGSLHSPMPCHRKMKNEQLWVPVISAQHEPTFRRWGSLVFSSVLFLPGNHENLY